MVFSKKQIRTDNILLLILCIILFCIGANRWSKDLPGVFITGDARGYYAYLLDVFIYHTPHHLPGEIYKGWPTNEQGELFIKFTCGVAFCVAPFFLVAHACAYLFHYDPSGFSAPYSYALMLASICWAGMGLYFLKKLLNRYFTRGATWLTLLCIVLGTNFYNYAAFEVGMSHVYSFGLFAALLLAVDNYYNAPAKGRAILIALLYSWIVLIRPTNAAILIFLMLYRVSTVAELNDRINFLYKRAAHALIALPFFVILLIPQLLYWKTMTGAWIRYSYDNQDFRYVLHPKIAEVLFDTQNGLFTWSPILLFFLWGIFMRRKDQRANALAVGVTFTIITYIFASWWAWWFGGAFGHRCYIEYYTVIAFPLAITMERILSMKKYVAMAPFFLVIAFFCYYNIFMTNMYRYMGVFQGPDWQWNWQRWYEELVKKM